MSRSFRVPPLLAALLAALTLTPAAHAAGRVDMRFVEPQRFTDVGFGTVERERNLEALQEHASRLAARLPDGQQLVIDVLDVDMAGATFVSYRHPELRVMRGTTDWPRLRLRWTLQDANGPQRSGESQLSDPGYLQQRAGIAQNGALGYEKRMLDRWLRDEVLGPR